MPLLKQADAPWPIPAYTMVHHKDVVGKSVRTERWRYTEWDGGKQGVELYDHQDDSGECRNLAGKAQHSGAVAEMARLLRR